MFNKHATCPFNSDMSHVIKNKYMLKDFLRTKMLWRRVCKGTLCSGYMAISLLAMAACSDNYEWAQDKPAWLGESIYDELQKRGNFSIYLKMADDLGRTDFLKKTGSVTVFVADDDAFRAFFKKNGLDENHLTPAMKKYLVNSSMLENAYVLDLLTNQPNGDDILKGQIMRRTNTLWTVYDSIPAVSYAQLTPASVSSDRWSVLRDKHQDMYNVIDNGTTPMVHFLWRHMMAQGMTKEDFSYLFNGKSFDENDVYVNNVKVREGNVTCQNGYIHIMDDVPSPLLNMSSYLRANGKTNLFSQMIDRFSAPFSATLTAEQYKYLKTFYAGQNLYNDLAGGDSIYERRYFWKDANGNGETMWQGQPVASLLKFDPGQNDYTNGDLELGNDMASVFAPTDDALITYWNSDDGAFLRERYPSEVPFENVPDNVLVEFVNNHMQYSFLSSLPSKFNTVLDDAKDQIGLDKADIVKESTSVCCNGAVYVMSNVYAPASFRSVIAPCLVEDNLKIMNWAVSELEFKPYLLSMVSYYNFLIFTDEAFSTYIDPVSYNTSDPRWFSFYYDETSKTVQAYSYRYDKTVGGKDGCKKEDMKLMAATQNTDGTYTPNATVVNRLTDILNFCIVPRDVSGGNVFGNGALYYMTKDDGMVEAHKNGEGIALHNQLFDTSISSVNSAVKDNGSYYIFNELAQATFTSLVNVLSSNPEYSEFYDLLRGNDEWTANEYNLYAILKRSGNYYSMNDDNTTVKSFNSYHYTVYVPDNQAMEKAFSHGLPRWKDINNLDEVYAGDENMNVDSLKKVYTERVISFLKYHLQDNAIYIGGGMKSGTYETAAFVASGEQEGLSYTLDVTVDGSNLSVKGNYLPEWSAPAKVVTTTAEDYNYPVREYSFDGNTFTSSISTSSYAVVHHIDEPLIYDKECLCLKDNERAQ